MTGTGTPVTITVTLNVWATPDLVAQHMDALHNLADVMLVQAEDGLWTLGSPDTEGSTLVARITTATATVAVTA